MLSVFLQLLSSSSSKFMTLGVKLSKISIFFISQNSGLSSKLNPTRQHESGICLIFKIEPQIPRY